MEGIDWYAYSFSYFMFTGPLSLLTKIQYMTSRMELEDNLKLLGLSKA